MKVFLSVLIFVLYIGGYCLENNGPKLTEGRLDKVFESNKLHLNTIEDLETTYGIKFTEGNIIEGFWIFNSGLARINVDQKNEVFVRMQNFGGIIKIIEAVILPKVTNKYLENVYNTESLAKYELKNGQITKLINE